MSETTGFSVTTFDSIVDDVEESCPKSNDIFSRVHAFLGLDDILVRKSGFSWFKVFLTDFDRKDGIFTVFETLRVFLPTFSIMVGEISRSEYSGSNVKLRPDRLVDLISEPVHDSPVFP